jgi:hypothetical protein
MTRYLCGHPSHAVGDDPEPVDVTPQVRLERMFPPRSLVSLAFTEDVIDLVRSLPEADPVERTRDVLRILTGDPSPHDGPLVLIEGSRVQRPPGMYQIDDLRTAEPAVGELLSRLADPSPPGPGGSSLRDDVVVLGDSGGGDIYDTFGTSTERIGTAAPADQRTRTLPQGVFSVIELAQRLASSLQNENELVQAIRRTAAYAAPLDMPTAPWRVIVECPVAPADEAEGHSVLFTGTGEPEPPVVYGVLPPARDVLLEDWAAADLNPAQEARRAELRLRTLLAGICAVTIAAGLLVWLAGGFAFLSREMTLWLALATVLAVAAIGVASYGLLSPIRVQGNLDDLLTVRTVYQHRIRFLWRAAMTSGGLFVLALLLVLLPALVVASASPPIPAPRIAFETTAGSTVARVSLTSTDVGRSDHLFMDARTFTSANDLRGVTIGRVTATGNSAGTARVNESLAINRDARFMAVRVWFGDHPIPRCSPRVADGAGCTLVTVPQPGASVPAAALGAIVQPSTTVITPTPSASISPSPTPSVSTSPFPTPTATP